MLLDLSILENAVKSLEEILNKTQNDSFMSQLDDTTRRGLKAGVIQYFEFSYELAWKFIKRWISVNLSPEDANNSRTRKDLFRKAAKLGLIKEPTAWFEYAEARNITSHTYNIANADLVYSKTILFLNDFKYLLEKLKENND